MISSIVPQNHYLHQNYPNPFNPTTKEKFEILKLSFVKLTIFDVLGKKVDEVINDFKDLGEYEIEWDANSFPSGIYFYRIEVDNYSNTKRMILLK